MIVYITKYALTQGIIKREAEKSSADDMIYVRGGFCDHYYHKGEWHTTMDAAERRAELMRKNKLVSMKKQAERIKKMDFTTAKVVS